MMLLIFFDEISSFKGNFCILMGNKEWDLHNEGNFRKERDDLIVSILKLITHILPRP